MKTSDRKKTALVTGSSRGIGRGIAVEMAGAGWNVAVNYAGNEEAAEETLRLCHDKAATPEQRFYAFKADIGNSGDREDLIEDVLSRFGGFHSLINNAGIAPKERVDLLDLKEESYDHLLNTNLKGTFFLSQTASRYWLSLPEEEKEFCSMIFISSVSSEMTSLNRAEYCIAKSGLSMASKLFASRLSHKGIGVYEIRPGIIQTDMTGAVKEKYDRLIDEGLVPQRRWGFPSDIGKAAVSLAKGDFMYSSGSVIHIDGGLHIPSL